MKIDIVSSFCWRGIYLDGLLAYEEESVSGVKMLDILNIPYNFIDLDRHKQCEQLPLKLEDLFQESCE